MAGLNGQEPVNEAHHTRSQEIAAQLTRRIVGGQVAAGEKMPSERDLAVEFATTRNVVREALKRLEAVGLVRIARGSGIYARNPQFTAGVELFDVMLKREDGSLNVEFLQDVLEFRGYFVRMLLRLAAVRRTDEELERIRGLVTERKQLRGDEAALTAITLRLFNEFARATHNQICQFLFNTVDEVSMRLRSIIDLPVLGFDQAQDIYERIVDAFDRKDSVLAELVAVRYQEAIQSALGGRVQPASMLHLSGGG